MKKNYEDDLKNKSQSILRSKLNFILLFLLLFSTQLFAQSAQKVTLNLRNAKLSKAIKEVQKQTSFHIIYNVEELNTLPAISINVKDQSLGEVLSKLLEGTNLQYNLQNNKVIIGPKGKSETSIQSANLIDVEGKVLDDEGYPMQNVNVTTINRSKQTLTNAKGEFSLKGISEKEKLTFSYLGYNTQTVVAKTKMKVKLDLFTKKLDDVVVTGTGINRKVSSFTGATATFSGEQLKAIGNNNIISSLKALDPSFIQIDNELAGSNPNVLPTLELRGKTTVEELSLKDQFGTDPNQPLFVLDGFETTLQTIVDLDMNRVASVVILKDAASTALYGSKAANGVVVIETVKPVPGKLRFSYTNDSRVEGPDLTVYNMMNAAEKLEFERLSGRYQTNDLQQELVLDSIYNVRLTAIARGVDSYWLAEPLRNIVSQNHSISATGGDEAFRYGVSFNYKMNPGVMKGSARDSWGSNVNLNYRKSKVNITNSFSVGGDNSTESPYGNFATYVNMNPYYEKNTTNPNLDKTKALDEFVGAITTIDVNVPNPLYNASLPFKNEGTGLNLTNNLSVQYEFLPKFRLNGAFSLSKGIMERDIFTSPDHTDYTKLEPMLRGKYSNFKSNMFNYSTNALLSYGNVFGGKHSVTANLRGQLSHNYTNSEFFTAQGFPTQSEPVLRFGYGYELNGTPSASSSAHRSVNATASTNYSYASRYLFDASYRIDGQSSFGKNDLYSPYWSSGIGWNMHNESFLKNNKKINRIKLYTNIGVTGNQTMGMSPNNTIYQYLRAYNIAGLGINVQNLGNPDLLPSKTTQVSSGIDFGFFGDRLTGAVTAYNKVTNNQVNTLDYPTSSGVPSYSYNVGKLITRGAELRVNYAVVNDKENRIVWRVGVTGATNDSYYDGFGDALKKLDAKQITEKALTRFKDGTSPNDLYTAISLGIDPASGREMFLTETGDRTTDYNSAYKPRVGSIKPLVEGVLSNQFTYKNLSLSLIMRYKAKGDVLNSALLEKVENIDFLEVVNNNQDKRALYDRWKKTGDIAQFKSISLTEVTQMSSRFLQEENSLSFESINMSYTFGNAKWMKNFGFQNLNLSAYANDIFRLSTVKRERGIQYPFARSMSFSLRASF